MMKTLIDLEPRIIMPSDDYNLKKIWEIPQEYRCPVIGTCLTTEEHKRVVKKAGYKIKGLKLYEIHRIIMMNLQDENPLSKRVDSLLNNKYKTSVDCMENWNERKLRFEWDERFQNGYFEDLLFVIAIKRGVSDDTLDNVFGEVHMISHIVINQESKANQEIIQLKNRLKILEDQNTHRQHLNRELKKENKKLGFENSELKKGIESNAENKPASQTNTNDASPIDSPDLVFTDKINQLEKANIRLWWQQSKLEEKNNELVVKTDEYKELNTHLKSDIEELISHFTLLSEKFQLNRENPSPCDLCSKKVLIVGGMTKIRHLYQHLVESNGGRFEYHDGCLKNGSKNLSTKVSGSDIIICPVNCNSHNACTKVKKLCHQHNKSLKILSNSSISSITTALFSNDVSIDNTIKL